ncbi:MAG TPA: hypothetical protein VD793_03370 [Gemmatimonadales bacterium]|nr:hypothetical protein [Gemmatimonadales bacterium]
MRSAVWLGPEARAVVHGLKYGGLSHLGMFAAELIARAVRQPPEGLLLPVPLTAARRRHRGYNQALVIARALGTRWSLPVVEGVLLRPGTATSQTQVRAGSRGANVAGAFLATAPPQRPGAGAGSPPAVIIVDDVFTTGATVQAAATALVEAGWRNLGAVTWARAMPIEFRIL